MLIDARGTVVVSSLGWVDRGGLWVLRVADGRETRVALSEAEWLSLHPGRDDHLAVMHHFEGGRVEITVHALGDPAAILGRAVLAAGGGPVDGAAATWARVPAYYTAYCREAAWADYGLVRVDAAAGRVEAQRLEWYDEAYDKDYQGIVGVAEVPGQDLVIVSVQRNSQPVLYDPVARRKVGVIDLAGHLGNPTLRFRRHARELWADDYDVLVKLEPGTWRRLGARRLQSATAGSGAFIGPFCFDAEETLCVVPRPYSGDVLALDPRTMRKRFRARTGGQPLDAMALPDGSVVAREWKTGALLRGPLKRIWLW